LSETVICAFLRDFSKHGERAIAEVRRKHPAAYLKIAVLLGPRDLKVEHTNPLGTMSDDQLQQLIDHMQESLETRLQSERVAKVIDGKAVTV